MADALAQLATREHKDDEDGTSRGPRLLLIADYDIASRELRNGRLGDGTPIPVKKIRDLACQSDILPGDLPRGIPAVGPGPETTNRQSLPNGWLSPHGTSTV